MIAADETLEARCRARLVTMEEVLAAAIARDLGTNPDDLRARLAPDSRPFRLPTHGRSRAGPDGGRRAGR